ncbi:hypothetical protein SAMN05443247_07524 [Bradyrhizobium erythrophlei]|jgi:hypothetical protein|nr:hypothetical protein SAMN05443247_07524 [Bradyrhizobium erythrophlei]
MTEPDIFDQEIHALQQRLRAAWQQLGDPTLTAFTRRELRNQMKQCSADLRSYLQKAAERRSQPVNRSGRTFSKPDLRILA